MIEKFNNTTSPYAEQKFYYNVASKLVYSLIQSFGHGKVKNKTFNKLEKHFIMVYMQLLQRYCKLRTYEEILRSFVV